MDSKVKNKIWVIAGAESSGKTTLFESLKREFPSFQFVSEYNREWLESRNFKAPFSLQILNELFVDSIQYYQSIHFQKSTIMDTDFLNLVIWAKFINHPMLETLEREWNKTQFYYLLCPPNIPFENDPLRSDDATRQWSWSEHVMALKKRQCFVLQDNDALQRIQQAVDIILLKG